MTADRFGRPVIRIWEHALKPNRSKSTLAKLARLLEAPASALLLN